MSGAGGQGSITSNTLGYTTAVIVGETMRQAWHCRPRIMPELLPFEGVVHFSLSL